MTADVLLAIEHVTMRFGGLLAVDDVSFDIRRGDITAVIGPNGAGKTTLFNCVTGFYRPTAGRMAMADPAGGPPLLLERMPGYDIAGVARIARTFQNIRLFAGMTALENLLIAQHNPLMRASRFSFAGLFGLPGYREAERAAIAKATFWLEKVGLVERADDQAGDLPYGAQRRLEIARAMCIEPVLLCLDEPAAGLNPRESHELNLLLRSIRDDHATSVLLIEHDMSVVMRISDHIVVLDHGAKISDGTPAEVRADPNVIRAYLGQDDEDEIPAVIAADIARSEASLMLSLSGIHTYYGAIEALKGVDVEVRQGEIVTLIGANGAGKSTLLMTICGNPQARHGSVTFEGREITRLPTHEIARLGIAVSPEGRRIFPRMTVQENLQMGALTSDPKDFEADLASVFAMFPRLEERRAQRGGTLSGGEQQMLAIGRALMSRPRLLLLDEPSLGLAPMIVKQIFSAIRTINRERGMTVFLVEQNAFHALRLAHRGYVMVNGRVTLTGTGADLLSNPEVRAAYLEGGH